jgi:hypothetical protein
MVNSLSNFVINNLYPNNSAFINFPTGYDSNLSYSITSSDPAIASITNNNVINALSVGSADITFTQNGDSISTTLTVESVPVLVSADNQSMIYGSTLPTLTYSINNQIVDLKRSCNKQNIGIIIARQKVGYGINLNSGSKISDLTGINLSRFDAGNSTNPYINIWVTNSDYTNYATISISPTWNKEYSNASYADLQNEDIFIYETTGVQLSTTGNYPTLTLGYQGTSWIASVSGVSGATSQLKLSDLANLEIKAPPTSWFDGTHGTGSGAPRELSTYNAYGFNWIFVNVNNNGDGTLADYIIGNATSNNSSSFTPYIIRNANNGEAPTISTDVVYTQYNISIGSNPITTSANSNSNVNNYNITFDSSKFTNLYNLTFNSGTLTITKASLNVTADNKSRAYGTSNPTFTYSYSGFKNSDPNSVITGTPSANTSATVTSNVGTYSINTDVSGLIATNYDFTGVNGTLTITKASLNVTSDNKSRAYGTSNPTFTYSYSGFQNSDTDSVITGTPSTNTTATVTSNVGTYSITTDVSGLIATNYDFASVNGTLTITKATLNVTANSTGKAYGQNNPSFSFSYSGFKNSDPNSVFSGTPILTSSATNTSNAGTYDIVPDVSGLSATNYDFNAVNGTLTIYKAMVMVQADNKSKTYGTNNPTFTFSYIGLLNGNDSSVITGTPTLTTNATVTSNSGTYSITPTISSLSATNYDFASVTGTLTVNKAILNVTADNKSKNYGDNNPTFSYVFNGFKNSDNDSVIAGSPVISTTSTQSSGVNGPNSDKTYTITVSNGTLRSTNYNFNPINAKLTINPITPTVSWKQSYVPPMIYNCQLTDNQLSALSTDKITGLSNGNFVYNVVSSTNVQTNVSLGSTIPTIGDYTLYATLNVTNPNYLATPIITISKKLSVVTSNLNVKWYNPSPISHNNALTSNELNALCNDPNATVSYSPPLGNTLSIGNKNLSVTFNTSDPGFTYDKIKNTVNINIV